MSSNSSESETSYYSDSEDVKEYADYEREVELSSEDESTHRAKQIHQSKEKAPFVLMILSPMLSGRPSMKRI